MINLYNYSLSLKTGGIENFKIAVSGKSPENKQTVMSNDAFYVTRPPCFWFHFLTDESIGAQSPDI